MFRVGQSLVNNLLSNDLTGNTLCMLSYSFILYDTSRVTVIGQLELEIFFDDHEAGINVGVTLTAHVILPSCHRHMYRLKYKVHTHETYSFCGLIFFMKNY